MSSYLRAKFAFEAENDDEISFKKGEYLIVESVDADGEWVTGRIARKDGESKSGLFPMNYCKKVDKLPWITKTLTKDEVKARAAFAFGMCVYCLSISLSYLHRRFVPIQTPSKTMSFPLKLGISSS